MKTEIYHCDACGEEITGSRYEASFHEARSSANRCGQQYTLGACSQCTAAFRAAVSKAMAASYQTTMGRDPNATGSRARSSTVISGGESG